MDESPEIIPPSTEATPVPPRETTASPEPIIQTAEAIPEAAPAPAAETVVEPVPPAPVPVSDAPAPTPITPPKPQTSAPHWGRFTHEEVRAKAIATRRAVVEKALARIVAYVSKKGSISNDEVEKLDKVVDSTAALYLKQLVQRGLLRKTGTNRTTRYEKDY